MPSRAAIANRTLTIFAAGLLAFDGACLVVAGAMLGRVLLLIVGGSLIVSSGLVFVYWKHHRRRTAELAADRRALREQARAFRNLIQRN